MWSLRGIFFNTPYEESDKDIKYLQGLLTKILRRNGTGFIHRVSR